MPASVRLVYNEGQIRELMTGPSGGVTVYMHRQGERVRAAARRNAPKDTGRLAGSITSEMQRAGDRVIVRVGSNLPYAKYVEEGTGIYAGRGMIRPRNGAFLVWPAINNSGSGARRYQGGSTKGWVYARAVRGQPGQHYLERALDSIR